MPEGFTAAMIAERLEAANLANAEEFLAWVRDPASTGAHGVEGTSLEGYLFPETYRLPRGLTPRETAAVFVDQFLEVWRELEPRARERNLSMHEVVTLASIVEKETGVPEERAADRGGLPEPPEARHAARDRSDGDLRDSRFRRQPAPQRSRRPRQPVQHLSHRGPAARAHRQPRAGRPRRRRGSRRRGLPLLRLAQRRHPSLLAHLSRAPPRGRTSSRRGALVERPTIPSIPTPSTRGRFREISTACSTSRRPEARKGDRVYEDMVAVNGTIRVDIRGDRHRDLLPQHRGGPDDAGRRTQPRAVPHRDPGHAPPSGGWRAKRATPRRRSWARSPGSPAT